MYITPQGTSQIMDETTKIDKTGAAGFGLKIAAIGGNVLEAKI